MVKNILIKDNHDYSERFDFDLSPTQQECVEFLLNRTQGSILGLQAGFGKTLVSLCASARCLEMSKLPLDVVILCPKSALNSFKKELEKMLKQPYSIYTTDLYKVTEGAKYHIFSLSRLDYLEEFLKNNAGNKLLIFDEVHCMSTKSKRNTLLNTLRPFFKIVWGLTATPLIDKLDGLYPTINFVRPGYLGTKTSFTANFLKTKLETVYTKRGKIKKPVTIGLKNDEQLKSMLDRIVITKTKTYNIEFDTRTTRLTDDEFNTYKLLAKGLDDDRLEPKEFSARLVDLQYLVDGCHPEHLNSKLCSKEQLLVQTLMEIMKRDEAVLVYCEYENSYNRIESILDKVKHLTNHNNVYKINGSVKFKDRVYIEDNIAPRDIILLSKAGSASINLQKANNIIVYDSPFSQGTLIQLIGRICRTDTKFDTQFIYFLEVLGTIDTYRRKVCESKLNYVLKLFGNSGTVPEVEDVPIDMKQLKRELLWFVRR